MVQLFGTQLDALQHLPFHYERGGLHEGHSNAGGHGGQAKAIAADQAAPSRCRDSMMNVQTQLPSSERHARTCSDSTTLDPHSVRAIAERVADLGMLDTRAGHGSRCACSGRAGSRSSRTCTRLRAARGPSARAMARSQREVHLSRSPASLFHRRPRAIHLRGALRMLPPSSLPS